MRAVIEAASRPGMVNSMSNRRSRRQPQAVLGREHDATTRIARQQQAVERPASAQTDCLHRPVVTCRAAG